LTETKNKQAKYKTQML